MLKYKKLGRSGPQVTAIGFGTWGMGGRFTKDSGEGDSQSVAAIRCWLDAGANFIDTAEAYAQGHAEALIKEALRGRSDSVVVGTKVSPENLNRTGIVQAVESSLKRLGCDRIDLYQIHWPNPEIVIEETLQALAELVNAGKIRQVGLSNFSLRQLKAAQAVSELEIATVQAEYNLFDRTVESDLLPYCQEQGISLIAYSPLDQGFVSPGSSGFEVLRKIAASHDRTPAQVALNWLASHDQVIPIPKASTPAHIHQNMASLDFQLEPEELKSIEQAFPCEPLNLPVEAISVDKSGLENFVPGPDALAREIAEGEKIKEIRVRRDPDNPDRYILVEGKLRYWAWVQAHGNASFISALLREG